MNGSKLSHPRGAHEVNPRQGAGEVVAKTRRTARPHSFAPGDMIRTALPASPGRATRAVSTRYGLGAPGQRRRMPGSKLPRPLLRLLCRIAGGGWQMLTMVPAMRSRTTFPRLAAWGCAALGVATMLGPA